MSVELRGVIELQRALRKFTPDLERNVENGIDKALQPVVHKARGFAHRPSGLSSWFKDSGGSFPKADISDIVRGIHSSTDPSRPNSRGFTSLVRLVNSSRAGAIMETAGRKNPNGRAPVNITYGKEYGTLGTEGKRGGKIRGNLRSYKSNNPFAGYQFVTALQNMSKIESIGGGRKKKGRLIFKAWKRDQGVANAAVIKAIESTRHLFYVRTKGKRRGY
jgi:hypothetical protein